MIGEIWTILEGIAAAFAIVGGLYGTYEVVRRRRLLRPYTKTLPMFAGTNEVRDNLVKLKGRTVNFDTVLDFCVWNEFSNRVVSETDYGKLLSGPASNLNRKPLPLFVETQRGALDSFATLVVSLRDSDRLKFSYGGTGVVQLLLKGRFDVEVRAYSGPSVEITLREAS